MSTLALASAWMPTSAAARSLDVHPRTLQRWARAGRIDSRTAPDGRTEYRVTPGLPRPRHTPTPPTETVSHEPPGVADTPTLNVAAVSALAAELATVTRRAVEAELDAERLREELRTVRAAAQELEARHRKRGELLRRIASRR